MLITVVIITHNNYLLKDGCIEATILSLMNQKDVDFEIVIVDNCSDRWNRNKLDWFVSTHCTDNVRLVYNEINSISGGRNVGIKAAKGKIIVFVDDDVIVIQTDALNKIAEIAKTQCYGYSAVRLWTPENWFQSNKQTLIRALIDNRRDYDVEVAVPDSAVRGKKDNRHLLRTYIGNFGFAMKDVLCSIGYWNEDYSGYGIEDDTMALNLFLKYGRPALLNGISVVHIWHRISEKNYRELEKNRKLYNVLLQDNGIRIFHVGRLLYNEPDVIEYIN